MEEVRLGESSLFVLPVVRGLPRDGAAVAKAIDEIRPEAVAVSISPEEVDALRGYQGTPVGPENLEEEVYVAGLSAWEEPVKPPPCFTEAVRVAMDLGVRLEGLDLDEDAYTDAYTSAVSTMELILQGRMESRLGRKKFRAQTPEEFVLEWDAEVNRTAGFARLQKIREGHMASRLREIAQDTKTVLAVIEVERAKGVLGALRD
ncbi:MAG TPA: hypothetical protein VIB49_01535 [Thermoplasmata archaeon]|jgi:hypothetical protein